MKEAENEGKKIKETPQVEEEKEQKVTSAPEAKSEQNVSKEGYYKTTRDCYVNGRFIQRGTVVFVGENDYLPSHFEKVGTKDAEDFVKNRDVFRGYMPDPIDEGVEKAKHNELIRQHLSFF